MRYPPITVIHNDHSSPDWSLLPPSYCKCTHAIGLPLPHECTRSFSVYSTLFSPYLHLATPCAAKCESIQAFSIFYSILFYTIFVTALQNGMRLGWSVHSLLFSPSLHFTTPCAASVSWETEVSSNESITVRMHCVFGMDYFPLEQSQCSDGSELPGSVNFTGLFCGVVLCAVFFSLKVCVRACVHMEVRTKEVGVFVWWLLLLCFWVTW